MNGVLCVRERLMMKRALAALYFTHDCPWNDMQMIETSPLTAGVGEGSKTPQAIPALKMTFFALSIIVYLVIAKANAHFYPCAISRWYQKDAVVSWSSKTQQSKISIDKSSPIKPPSFFVISSVRSHQHYQLRVSTSIRNPQVGT